MYLCDFYGKNIEKIPYMYTGIKLLYNTEVSCIQCLGTTSRSDPKGLMGNLQNVFISGISLGVNQTM